MSKDAFTIQVGKYLSDRIDFKTLMEVECSIMVTKQIPLIKSADMVPGFPRGAASINYTEVQINFGPGAEGVFEKALLKCTDVIKVCDYGKVKSAKRFAFQAKEFSYLVNDTWYRMGSRDIIVQLAGSLVETPGPGITMVVTGKAYRYAGAY